MSQYSLLCLLDLCTGCRSCEVACKQENSLPVGTNWMQVVQIGPRKAGNKLAMDFVPTHCMHCVKPPCLPACPLGAITKRSDGIVLVNQELCDGCLACLEACPFGVMQLNPETGTVGMCTLCAHRIDEGLVPSCVHHCQAKCLKFGEINKLAAIQRTRAARKRAFATA